MNILPFDKLREFLPTTARMTVAEYFNTDQASTGSLKTSLSQNDPTVKSDALLRILAGIYKGTDVSAVYPDIMNQLSVPDAGVKRLSYACLAHIAESSPDLILLSVNAIQRDLLDLDPRVRGLAIRIVCRLKHESLAESALEYLERASVDSSGYVRKSAAAGLSACAARVCIDSHSGNSRFSIGPIRTILDRFLADGDSTVLTESAILLWQLARVNADSFSDTMSLLHKHYVHLVSQLSTMEWQGQFHAIRVLYHYSLRNFSTDSTNPHFQAFIENITALVRFGSSPPVVQLAISVLSHLLPKTNLSSLEDTFELAIIRLLNSCDPVAVPSILAGVDKVRRIKPFLINTALDSDLVKKEKLRILKNSVTKKKAKFVLSEIGLYIASSDEVCQADCIASVTRIASVVPELRSDCLSLLVTCLAMPNANIAAVSALRSLITGMDTSPAVMKTVCIQLANVVCEITNAEAKASAIWLLWITHDFAPIVVPNTAQRLAMTITTESPVVKLELCVLSQHMLTFHAKNSQAISSAGGIPPLVSSALLDKLHELNAYILKCAGGDAIVGGMVRGLSVCPEVEWDVVKAKVAEAPEDDCDVAAMYRRLFDSECALDYTRATEDSPDSLREVTRAHAVGSGPKSMASDRSATNRTSSSVTVPSSASAISRAVPSLAQLDLFFTSEGVPEIRECIPDTSAGHMGATSKHIASGSSKATVDLTDAAWLEN